MSQKFLNLVKTQIFYEFLKLALSRTRPSKRENGTSDVFQPIASVAPVALQLFFMNNEGLLR